MQRVSFQELLQYPYLEYLRVRVQSTVVSSRDDLFLATGNINVVVKDGVDGTILFNGDGNLADWSKGLDVFVIECYPGRKVSFQRFTGRARKLVGDTMVTTDHLMQSGSVVLRGTIQRESVDTSFFVSHIQTPIPVNASIRVKLRGEQVFGPKKTPQDPFVAIVGDEIPAKMLAELKFKKGDPMMHIARTKHISKTADPNWEWLEIPTLRLMRSFHEPIWIVVGDHNTFSGASTLGVVKITVKELLQPGMRLELFHEKARGSPGTIVVEDAEILMPPQPVRAPQQQALPIPGQQDPPISPRNRSPQPPKRRGRPSASQEAVDRLEGKVDALRAEVAHLHQKIDHIVGILSQPYPAQPYGQYHQ